MEHSINNTFIQRFSDHILELMRLSNLVETVRIENQRVQRGMFQYYGAHTGRWANRLVQLHNLPRPKVDINTAVSTQITITNYECWCDMCDEDVTGEFRK